MALPTPVSESLVCPDFFSATAPSIWGSPLTNSSVLLLSVFPPYLFSFSPLQPWPGAGTVYFRLGSRILKVLHSSLLHRMTKSKSCSYFVHLFLLPVSPPGDPGGLVRSVYVCVPVESMYMCMFTSVGLAMCA